VKIPLGGGAYLEPDEEPRASRHHKLIVETVGPIPETRVGHYAVLECGHRVMLFGRIELAGGRVLCTQCRDQEVTAPGE
jgi:hypothetical protein